MQLKYTTLYYTIQYLANMNEQLCIEHSIFARYCDNRFEMMWYIYSSFFCSSSENAVVKKLLKLVNIWPSYWQNKKVPCIWITVYITLHCQKNWGKRIIPHNSRKCGPISIIFFHCRILRWTTEKDGLRSIASSKMCRRTTSRNWMFNCTAIHSY